MEISRRNFIKIGVGGVVGGVVLAGGVPGLVKTFAASAASANAKPKNTSNSSRHYWRFAVDIRKCIGCGACLRACKKENDVNPEPEFNRTWVERYVVDEDEKMFVDSPKGGIEGFNADYMNVKYKDLNIRKSYFVPKLCNHCDKPPCVSVCPVGATYSSPEGVVLVNRNACIGCRYCVQACPFGARFFDPRFKIVDKCTWCYHRITKGMLPACVEVCPTGARMFGDIRDSQTRVSQVINEEHIGILKGELGAENKVYYVGLENGVR
jgi:Fe-S-cluster-containing dehydrogenase component